MILEVDIGNSRVKWRVLVLGQIIASGSGSHQDCIHELSALERVPDIVRVASVVPDLEQCFRDWCIQQWGLEPKFAQVTHICSGVINGYDDISQMGVDRWSAMVAAFANCQSACLVVDSGSALTVDVLRADGQHLGGYIVPGLFLMRESLIQDTARVQPPAVNYDGSCTLGHSTQEAVAAGLRVMHSQLVIQALLQLSAIQDQSPVIFITGGGADTFAYLFKVALTEQGLLANVDSVEINPWLVMDGLHWLIA